MHMFLNVIMAICIVIIIACIGTIITVMAINIFKEEPDNAANADEGTAGNEGELRV